MHHRRELRDPTLVKAEIAGQGEDRGAGGEPFGLWCVCYGGRESRGREEDKRTFNNNGSRKHE